MRLRTIEGWCTMTIASIPGLTSILDSDPTHGPLTYGYSVAGDLVSFTDRAGKTYSYSYDGQHNLLNATAAVAV